MARALKCYGTCGNKYPKEELINYKGNNYCFKCHKEKLMREKFAQKVCDIFKIKAPGPRIWAERKRIQETFGFTDETLIMTLEYIFNVKQVKYLSESLCKINAKTVDEALTYWRVEKNQEEMIEKEAEKPITIHLVRVENKVKKNKLTDGFDEFFNS